MTAKMSTLKLLAVFMMLAAVVVNGQGSSPDESAPSDNSAPSEGSSASDSAPASAPASAPGSTMGSGSSGSSSSNGTPEPTEYIGVTITISITFSVDYSIWTADEDVYNDLFITAMSEGLGVSKSRFTVTGLESGSTIVTSQVRAPLNASQLSAFFASNLTAVFIGVYNQYIADGGNPNAWSVSGFVVTTPAPGSCGAVVAAGFPWNPQSVIIKKGQTVCWTGLATHNVASTKNLTTLAYDGRFRSGTVGAVTSYSRTFRSVGVYHYFCEAHSNSMKGTITVSSASHAAQWLVAAIVALVAMLR